MIISRYTRPELERIEELANFTTDEREMFWYRARKITLEESAEKMNVSISTAKRISSRITDKITRLN